MAKSAILAVSLALLTITSQFFAGSAMAQEDIDTLKAENAALTEQLARVTDNRDHLADRLRRAIAFSKSNRQKLENATKGRDELRGRLRRAIAHSKGNRQKLEEATQLNNDLRGTISKAIENSRSNRQKLKNASEGRDELRGRLRRAIAHSKETRQKLENASQGRDELRGRLRRAIAHSKGNRQKLENASNGRDELRGRLRRAIAHSKSNRMKLESATADRKNLSDRLRRAIAYSKSSRQALEEKLAECNGTHGAESMVKEEATTDSSGEWAASVNESLQAAIGGLQGTVVSPTSDNGVNVLVGNVGLFRTGSSELSGTGRDLLSQIGQELSQHNAAITVIGHTDNVPVGSSSSFSDNAELSLARAESTVQFLLDEGVSTSGISVAGFGADFPIASNDTAEGRQQNRRVEIVLKEK